MLSTFIPVPEAHFYGAVITRKSVGWTLTLKDGTKYDLPEAFQQTKPFCQAIIGITDRFGNHITLDRDLANNCQLTKITSPNGRFITLTHDAQGRITQATDNIGRTVSLHLRRGGQAVHRN